MQVLSRNLIFVLFFSNFKIFFLIFGNKFVNYVLFWLITFFHLPKNLSLIEYQGCFSKNLIQMIFAGIKFGKFIPLRDFYKTSNE
jgi:hypothetical protein